MLTCHQEGCQDADCGSCGPEHKQLREEVPQGEEEGPERDVVEPRKVQTETGTEGLLVLCRGRVGTRLHCTQMKIQEGTGAKGKGDLVLRKTWPACSHPFSTRENRRF